jgi:ankyrin repeat protein
MGRLIYLGFLCILYEYWKGLEASSNPPLHTETGTTINSNLKHLAWCTAHAAQCTLKTIISLIEVESRSTESQALRYREALDTVEDINKLGSRSEVLVELEVTVLSKLILIYEQQNDEPTVRRFSLRRSKLQSGSSRISDPCHIEHAAQCWLRTTGKLPSLVKSLDLQVEAPLRTNATPLFPAQHSAVRCGHDDIANVLCKLDGAFQNHDMLQQDPILAAAAVGKLSLFDTHVHDDKSLLKSRDLFQRTLLFHTSGRGNLETFVTLVQAGANVFDRDEAGQSILGAACAAGNLDVVRWLLEVGGVETPNDHFFGPRSPLHDAARSGHKGVCSLLLEKGAYVDYLVENVTPAQAARANGFNDLAEMLESCLANSANQYPSNSSFDAPQHPMEANAVPSLDVYQLNKYGCPSPLPSGVSYADVAAGKKRDPTEYRNSLLASSPTESEVEFDRLPLDDSIDVVDSGRLFGD